MKEVLITGATAGIGRACAERFLRQGWRVTAVARSAEDLAALVADHPAGAVRAVAADLSLPAGPAAVPQRAYDAVVLNAAVYRPGGLLDPEADVFTESWALNVRANHELARAQVPGMVTRGAGSLVVIGSVGTDDWPGGMTAYLATKYALRGLFLGWQRELAGSGVSVALVAPGATLTRSWAGETNIPSDILAPGRVAELVYGLVLSGRGGRHLLTGDAKGPHN